MKLITAKITFLFAVALAPISAITQQNTSPAQTPQKTQTDAPPSSATQSPPPSSAPKQISAAPENTGALQKVFQRMDATARDFRSVKANFTWTHYNSVVNEEDEKDLGTIYFRRSGGKTEMAADITSPARKKIVFDGEKVEILEPGGQVDTYDAQAHKEEFEAFLVLGFGSSSEDIKKSFDVKYVMPQKVGGMETDEIELTPMAENIRSHFPRIDLWIDAKGISVQQQLFEADGDHRLAEYSSVQINPPRMPDKVFKLGAPRNGKTVTH